MNQLQPLSDVFLDHGGRGKVPTLAYTPYIVSPSRIREVTGVISRSRAYVLEQSDPDFPKRVRLSPSNTGWRYSELIAYIERRAAS